MPSFLAQNSNVSCVVKMSFKYSFFTFNNCFSVSKKQTTPWPPFKALEWTFVECVTPPTKHGSFWELKCKFCVKEF
jgi:hypothetical protein